MAGGKRVLKQLGGAMNCLRCGATMRESEKSSATGRTIREFTCPQCGFSEQEEDGIALWKQARKQEQEARPLWQRWLDWLRKGR